MNKEELKEPTLIWKGSVGEALRTGRLTQEQVDKWNMEEEMGEDYMNGFEEGFQKGKLEERKRVLELIDNYICEDNECKECLNMRMLKLKLQKEILGEEKGK